MHLTIGPGAALPLRYANRHALVTGATGTGKTVTLAAIAEGLGAAGCKVLAFDAKGDLDRLADRLRDPFEGAGLDLYQMGPDLLCRALELSEAQSGAVFVLYAMAEAEGLRLADLDDLRALCGRAADDLGRVSSVYGLVGKPSLAAVQRAALRLSRDGAGAFGRPGFDLATLPPGVTVYRSARLARNPVLYASFVTHCLLDLYHRAPESGDLDCPKWALLMDEAHLIFDGCPPGLLRRIESVVRLIRSKGVCLIFATQSPADLPPGISGQLATRVQHGLRAVTPAQVKGVRAAAESMPAAPGFDAMAAIQGLGIGQALVSVPGAGGVPGFAQVVQVQRGRRFL